MSSSGRSEEGRRRSLTGHRPPPASQGVEHAGDEGLIRRLVRTNAETAAGKLHDRASYRYYWELLDRAHVTGMDIPAAARIRFFA